MGRIVAVLLPLLLLGHVPAAPGADRAQPTSIRTVAPLAFYTPETGFAAGAALILIANFYPGDPNHKPNQNNALAYYTQKHQYVFDANTERFYHGNDLRLFASGDYRKFPDRFWGIGKETSNTMEEAYTQTALAVQANATWRVLGCLHLGPCYRFFYGKMTETETDGILQTGDVPGSQGIRLSGLGGEAVWDSRDNAFYPLQGMLVQLRLVAYRGFVGSSEDCWQIELDGRKFLRTYREQVLALQGKATATGGNVPFQLMAKLGGSTMMRGMFDGRFRDNDCLAVQAEYRVPLFWRFGAVVFASVGQVFSRREEFSWGDFETAGGIGGRFSIVEGQRINCRFDAGFYEEEIALYFKYQEAF